MSVIVEQLKQARMIMYTMHVFTAKLYIYKFFIFIYVSKQDKDEENIIIE